MVYTFIQLLGHTQYMTRDQFFSYFISDFSLSLKRCHIIVKETSLLYYLPITGGKSFKFIHFSRVLTLN